MAGDKATASIWSLRALFLLLLTIVGASAIVACLIVDELSAAGGLFEATNAPTPQNVFIGEWIVLVILSLFALVPGLAVYWLLRSPIAIGASSSWTAAIFCLLLAVTCGLAYERYLELDDGHLFEGDHRERISHIGKFATSWLTMTVMAFGGGAIVTAIGTAIKKLATTSGPRR